MNLKSVKIIAVDFDGTLCENSWPEIGEPNEELIEYLRNRKKDGDKLILWTCRVEDMLQKAVEWCKERNLVFDAVNENLPEIIENFGSDTRKIFANEYIPLRLMRHPQHPVLPLLRQSFRRKPLRLCWAKPLL